MTSHLSLTLTFAIVLQAGAETQESSQAKYIEVSKNTLALSCWAAVDNREGSRFARSDILISPDGRYRVFVETEALFTARETKASDPYRANCVATSKLFIAGFKGKDFKVQLTIDPTDKEGTLAGMEPIDWSYDSRFLLLAWQRSFYESEWSGSSIRLFDTRSGEFLQPDVYKALHEYFDRDCLVLASPEGFTADNRLVVGAWPEQYEPEDNCVQDATLLVYDPWKQTVHPLPNGYSIRRYGSVEGHFKKD